LDWDDAHTVRIFALAPVPDQSFKRLFQLFKDEPDRRVWIPPVLARASEETISDLYDQGIQNLIDHAATPTVAMAWSNLAEKTLALRALDSAASAHLSSWFERQPDPVVFDWFQYLHVVRQLQPA